MKYVKKNVPRAEGNPGLGIQNRDEISFIDVDDILHMPPADEKGVVIVDNIILRENSYSPTIYMTPGTVELTSNAEGDTDAVGYTPALKGTHPGNKEEIREFKNWAINKRFVIIIRYCSGQPADLIGTVCNPCKFTANYTGNKDANSNELNFAQISKGSDIFIYKGTIPTEEPVDVVEAGKPVKYLADGQYQLSPSENPLAEIEGGHHDAVITLLGASGSGASVAGVAGKIMLKEGKTFNGVAGTQLTLRAFDAGDGLVWIEQSRYEG